MAYVSPFKKVSLPKGWPKLVRSAFLHVTALAHRSLTYSRSWAVNSSLSRVRLQAALDEARTEVALLTEELRIKNGRLARIDPHQRPHYPPAERLAILELRAFLGRSMHAAGAVPRYLVSDKGSQFWCTDYRDWCERQGIHPRYASTGSLRATAIIERFFLSLKTEMPSLIGTALTRRALQEKLALYFYWFTEHRPRQGLSGRTPRELYHRLDPANEQPRFEPRANWPRRSGCARRR